MLYFHSGTLFVCLWSEQSTFHSRHKKKTKKTKKLPKTWRKCIRLQPGENKTLATCEASTCHLACSCIHSHLPFSTGYELLSSFWLQLKTTLIVSYGKSDRNSLIIFYLEWYDQWIWETPLTERDTVWLDRYQAGNLCKFYFHPCHPGELISISKFTGDGCFQLTVEMIVSSRLTLMKQLKTCSDCAHEHLAYLSCN